MIFWISLLLFATLAYRYINKAHSSKVFVNLSFHQYNFSLFTKNLKYWKKRQLNGPQPLPLFGNVLEILFTSRTELELKLYRKYGNLYGYYFGSEPVLVVAESELIKAILVKDFHIFSNRRGVDHLHPIMKKSLPNLVDDDWKRIRSITSPSFTSNKMKLMYPHMKDIVEDFVDYLGNVALKDSKVNVKEIFNCLSLSLIASLAFGTRLESRDRSSCNVFVKHANNIFRVNAAKILLLKFVPKSIFGTAIGRQSEVASTKFYVDVVQQMIQQRKECGRKFNDLLQLLLDADQRLTCSEGPDELDTKEKMLSAKPQIKNEKLNEDEIVAQAISFLLGAYETSASVLTCATYELALHPHVQEKLFNEISASLSPHSSLDYDMICSLPYLDAVIKETLRLHSPALKISRIAAQEYKVGDTGITVYPGQQIDIPIHAIHLDEKYYKNALEFEPDRFMPHNRHNLIPYTFLPFGSGLRSCIGMRFAMLEMKVALARMIREFSFLECDDTDVPFVSNPESFVQGPKRASLRIEKRK